MNIKNYYTKAIMLVISLGFIIAIQSCTKKPDLQGEDTKLTGVWKRIIHRLPLGDSTQIITFYEGDFSTFQTNVSATPASTPTSTLYRATYNTNGSQIFLILNQKQNSLDANGSGTPVNQVIFNKLPYKISVAQDTLTVTDGTAMKYVKQP
jgi:hypothetical protein